MRQLIVLKDAKQDIKKINAYTLQNWGTLQAKKYIQELKNTLILINKNPNLGFNKTDICDSAFSFPHKSHVIYYQFNDSKVFIVRILHQSQLPVKHLKDKF